MIPAGYRITAECWEFWDPQSLALMPISCESLNELVNDDKFKSNAQYWEREAGMVWDMVYSIAAKIQQSILIITNTIFSLATKHP